MLMTILIGAALTLSPPTVSDHFDGERFFNPGNPGERGLWDVVKWVWERHPSVWPEHVSQPLGPKPPERVAAGSPWRVTAVGHATVLVQLEGLNILTDPFWSERASPVSFAGPKRARPPAIALDDLPPLDLVLVSHNHFDHMDLPTLAQLAKRHQARFVTGLGNRKRLEDAGVSHIVELDWWQSIDLGKGRSLIFAPANHWSNRGGGDRNKSLWGAFVVKTSHGNFYFAGDTSYGSHFTTTRDRLGPMRLSLLPIGAYEPRWFMGPAHMNPEDAVKAHLDLASQTSIGIHFGTIQLSDEGINDPPKELERVLRAHPSISGSFVPAIWGQGVEIAK